MKININSNNKCSFDYAYVIHISLFFSAYFGIFIAHIKANSLANSFRNNHILQIILYTKIINIVFQLMFLTMMNVKSQNANFNHKSTNLRRISRVEK